MTDDFFVAWCILRQLAAWIEGKKSKSDQYFKAWPTKQNVLVWMVMPYTAHARNFIFLSPNEGSGNCWPLCPPKQGIEIFRFTRKSSQAALLLLPSCWPALCCLRGFPRCSCWSKNFSSFSRIMIALRVAPAPNSEPVAFMKPPASHV